MLLPGGSAPKPWGQVPLLPPALLPPRLSTLNPFYFFTGKVLKDVTIRHCPAPVDPKDAAALGGDAAEASGCQWV